MTQPQQCMSSVHIGLSLACHTEERNLHLFLDQVLCQSLNQCPQLRAHRPLITLRLGKAYAEAPIDVHHSIKMNLVVNKMSNAKRPVSVVHIVSISLVFLRSAQRRTNLKHFLAIESACSSAVFSFQLAKIDKFPCSSGCRGWSLYFNTNGRVSKSCQSREHNPGHFCTRPSGRPTAMNFSWCFSPYARKWDISSLVAWHGI